MKYLIILFFCILSASCNTQRDLEKIANNFVQDIIFDESSKSEKLESYVIVNPNLEKEKRDKLIKYANYIILEFKKSIARRSSEYRIITSSELKSDTTIKKEYNLKYEDKGNIFYLVSGDEVITHIIFNKDKKIISFFPGIHQGLTDHSPIMLDTFNSFE